MRHRLALFLMTVWCALVASCASLSSSTADSLTVFDEKTVGVGVTPGMPIGGRLGQGMGEQDRAQFNHALDKALGVVTTWTNARGDIQYTAVPTRKVTVHGNALCRYYKITAQSTTQPLIVVTGLACVASDGAWSEVE